MSNKSTPALTLLVELAKKRTRENHPNVPEKALPIPKYSDRSSNGLTKCIIDFIEMNGSQAERINSTGRIIDKRKTNIDVLGRVRTIGSVKWIKGSSQLGTADISATINGRSVKIEVKCNATGDRYQSSGQKDYQKRIEKAGGVYVIAKDFESFHSWYLEFIKTINNE